MSSTQNWRTVPRSVRICQTPPQLRMKGLLCCWLRWPAEKESLVPQAVREAGRELGGSVRPKPPSDCCTVNTHRCAKADLLSTTFWIASLVFPELQRRANSPTHCPPTPPPGEWDRRMARERGWDDPNCRCSSEPVFQNVLMNSSCGVFRRGALLLLMPR